MPSMFGFDVNPGLKRTQLCSSRKTQILQSSEYKVEKLVFGVLAWKELAKTVGTLTSHWPALHWNTASKGPSFVPRPESKVAVLLFYTLLTSPGTQGYKVNLLGP